jgi:hypothetical protein
VTYLDRSGRVSSVERVQVVDRGVTGSGRMRDDPEEVEVVAQSVAGQKEGPVRVELHGDDGLGSNNN